MTTLEHYFCVLGLERGCTYSELKKAYRQKALQFHPDRNPTGTDTFKRVLQAYEELQRFFQQNGGKDNLRVRGTTRMGNQFSSHYPSSTEPTASSYSTTPSTSFSSKNIPTWSRFKQAAAAAGEHQKQKKRSRFPSSRKKSHEDPSNVAIPGEGGGEGVSRSNSSTQDTPENTLPRFEKQWWQSRSRRAPLPSSTYNGVRTETLRRAQPSHTTSDFIVHQFVVQPFTSIPKTLPEMDFLFDQLYSKHQFIREVLSKWQKEEKELFEKIKSTQMQALWVELQRYQEDDSKRKALRGEWSNIEKELNRRWQDAEDDEATHSSCRRSTSCTRTQQKETSKQDPETEEGLREEEEKKEENSTKESKCSTRKQKLLEELKQAEKRYEDAQELAHQHLSARRTRTVGEVVGSSSGETTESTSRKQEEEKHGMRRTVLIRRILSGAYLAEEKELKKLSDVEIYTVLRHLQQRRGLGTRGTSRNDKEVSGRRNPRKEKMDVAHSLDGHLACTTVSSPFDSLEEKSKEETGEEPFFSSSCPHFSFHHSSLYRSAQPSSFIAPQNVMLLEKVLRQRLSSCTPCSLCHVEPKSATSPSPFICNHPSVCTKCMRVALCCPICGARLTTPSSLVAPMPHPSSSAAAFSSVETSVPAVGGSGGPTVSMGRHPSSPVSDRSPLLAKSAPLASFTRSKYLASMLIPISGDSVPPPPAFTGVVQRSTESVSSSAIMNGSSTAHFPTVKDMKKEITPLAPPRPLPPASSFVSSSGDGGGVKREEVEETSLTAASIKAMWFQKYRGKEDFIKKPHHLAHHGAPPVACTQSSSSFLSSPIGWGMSFSVEIPLQDEGSPTVDVLRPTIEDVSVREGRPSVSSSCVSRTGRRERNPPLPPLSASPTKDASGFSSLPSLFLEGSTRAEHDTTDTTSSFETSSSPPPPTSHATTVTTSRRSMRPMELDPTGLANWSARGIIVEGEGIASKTISSRKRIVTTPLSPTSSVDIKGIRPSTTAPVPSRGAAFLSSPLQGGAAMQDEGSTTARDSPSSPLVDFNAMKPTATRGCDLPFSTFLSDDGTSSGSREEKEGVLPPSIAASPTEEAKEEGGEGSSSTTLAPLLSSPSSSPSSFQCKKKKQKKTERPSQEARREQDIHNNRVSGSKRKGVVSSPCSSLVDCPSSVVECSPWVIPTTPTQEPSSVTKNITSPLFGSSSPNHPEVEGKGSYLARRSAGRRRTPLETILRVMAKPSLPSVQPLPSIRVADQGRRSPSYSPSKKVTQRVSTPSEREPPGMDHTPHPHSCHTSPRSPSCMRGAVSGASTSRSSSSQPVAVVQQTSVICCTTSDPPSLLALPLSLSGLPSSLCSSRVNSAAKRESRTPTNSEPPFRLLEKAPGNSVTTILSCKQSTSRIVQEDSPLDSGVEATTERHMTDSVVATVLPLSSSLLCESITNKKERSNPTDEGVVDHTTIEGSFPSQCSCHSSMIMSERLDLEKNSRREQRRSLLSSFTSEEKQLPAGIAISKKERKQSFRQRRLSASFSPKRW